MKNLRLPLFILLAALVMTSCKKEVSPEIEITVVGEDGVPRRNALVKTSVDGANGGIINEGVLDEVLTDNFGKAFFKYENTILVDVAVYRGNRIVDSTSILAETKRLKRNEENLYERTLILRP